MVGAPTETEQVDQVPEEEQTEALEVDLGDAAEPQEEAAAPVEEAEKPLTKAELESLLAEREERIRREAEERAAERVRRERQREQGRIANEQRQQQADDAEAQELLSAQLVRLGLPEADPTIVKPLLDRYAQKRETQVTQRTLGRISEAFSAAAADVLGTDYDGDLDPVADSYRLRFVPFVEQMMEQAKTRIAKSGDYIHKADLPKLVDAEIAKRQAQKPPVKRVEGAPSRALTFEELESLYARDEATPEQEAQYRRMRRDRGL